ncbi:protein of unknown function DUF1017 [Paraglaciecola sp. T6c]|uniref:capsule biosynthesis GfcC family protein n=1 Tax=Pseudoalteromonas atlantica (strain T6c / ATCC BAA-1087) TaxID=3042615 RepID=UPI00005C7600|nr:capsule biosynthesis GfcC family protein [Paraglaciecola sp. T6c]ABG41709.1 protein of unknown function DUF1017 [Paraglaciecola sp. T6c]
MIKKYKSILFAAITSFSCVTSANVTIKWNEVDYTFDSTVRLTDVLSKLDLNTNIYWPSAALFIPNDVTLERARRSSLSNLNILASHLPSDTHEQKSVFTNLINELEHWHLANRLSVKIDYDLARISEAHNPQFDNGYYVVSLHERQESVEIIGAVTNTVETKHLPHTDVSEYLNSANIASFANRDTVIIIQADGRIIEAPTAYWNRQHQEVMPGSIIYVPFKESLFTPQYKELNQLIVTLAKNRLHK